MRNKGLDTGVNFNDVEKFICEGCVYGKQHRLQFKKRNSNVKKSKIGECIHRDLCGLMDTLSVLGYKYYVAFKDNFSGFRVANSIRHKIDVLDYKNVNCSKQNKLNCKIQFLYAGNG